MFEIRSESTRYRYFIVVDVPEEAKRPKHHSKYKQNQLEREFLTSQEVIFSVQSYDREAKTDDGTDQWENSEDGAHDELSEEAISEDLIVSEEIKCGDELRGQVIDLNDLDCQENQGQEDETFEWAISVLFHNIYKWSRNSTNKRPPCSSSASLLLIRKLVLARFLEC